MEDLKPVWKLELRQVKPIITLAHWEFTREPEGYSSPPEAHSDAGLSQRLCHADSEDSDFRFWSCHQELLVL